MPPAPAAQKIAFWLMKGGVGKSTRCLELGEMLYRKGKRVAIMEFDPQKDISKRIFRRDSVRERNDIKLLVTPPDDDFDGLFLSQADFAEFYERTEGRKRDPNNIYSALEPAIRGRGQQHTPMLVQVSDEDLGSDNQKPGLWLLPGHLNIQKYDNKVVAAYESKGNLAEGALFGLNKLCSDIQARYHVDYILIDLPPTSSPGVGHIICSSDGLVLPCECDGASWEAVRDSLNKLKEYKAEYDSLRDAKRDAPDWLQECKVKVLGTMQSNFAKEEGCDERYYHSQYAFWMRKIDAEMRNELQDLQERGLAYESERYSRAGVDTNCLCLSRTHHFASLDGMSQKGGRVVAFLPPECILDRKGKKIGSKAKKRVEEFYEILDKATLRIMTILHPVEGAALWAQLAGAAGAVILGPLPDHRTAITPGVQKKLAKLAGAAAPGAVPAGAVNQGPIPKKRRLQQ